MPPTPAESLTACVHSAAKLTSPLTWRSVVVLGRMPPKKRAAFSRQKGSHESRGTSQPTGASSSSKSASGKRRRAPSHASGPRPSIGAVLDDAMQLAQSKVEGGGAGARRLSRGAAQHGTNAPHRDRAVTPPLMRGFIQGAESPAMSSGGRSPPSKRSAAASQPCLKETAVEWNAAVEWDAALKAGELMEVKQAMAGAGPSSSQTHAAMPNAGNLRMATGVGRHHTATFSSHGATYWCSGLSAAQRAAAVQAAQLKANTNSVEWERLAAPTASSRQLPPVPPFSLPSEQPTPCASQPSTTTSAPKLPPMSTTSQPSTPIVTPTSTPMRPAQGVPAPPAPRQLPPVPLFSSSTTAEHNNSRALVWTKWNAWGARGRISIDKFRVRFGGGRGV